MDAGSSSAGSSSPGSSSEEKQRICAILNIGSDYYAVHIIDIALEDGAADDDAIVDLNRVDTYRFARQFVERDPNFFIQDFTETDGLCGLGSTIFMFEGVDYRRIKVDTLYCSMGIYSFPLSAEHTARTAGTEPIPCYHKSKLRKSSDMLGLKCSAEAVAVPVEHGATSSSTRIIIFSTQIEYFYDRSIDFDGRVVDFEIYNTESKLSSKLPPLRIGRQSATIFTLVDLVRDQSYCFTPKYNIECYWKGGEWRSSFRIRAYTFFNDDTFVVEPDFGGVRFSLDLASDSENQKWELFDVPLSLSSNYHHFTENLLVLSSYGAHEVGYECESSAAFPFPLCSFVSPQLERKTSSIILLHNPRFLDCVACIVQIGEDDSERPFWTMDVVEFNPFWAMPSCNYHGQFARRIKSFKFAYFCNSVSSCIAGLFAF